MIRRTISIAFGILFSAHSLLTAGLAQEKHPIIYVMHLEPPRISRSRGNMAGGTIVISLRSRRWDSPQHGILAGR
jgi:hypothetical protein